MNILDKSKSVITKPAMLAAYGKWIASKLLTGKPARVTLPGGTQLGEWLSFSEYWSFQDIVPDPERLFFERCLRKCPPGKGVAFDIGANVGGFTCVLASQGHQTHAFEPIPETFCRMKRNVAFNGLLGNTHLNCLAMGAEKDVVNFHIDEDSPAVNRMTAPDVKSPCSASSQLVAVVDLDSYCNRLSIDRIDFMKLDVEGMEPHVLRGARNLLSERRIAAILIEICPVNLHSVGLSPAMLFHEFRVARYSPYILGPDGIPGKKLSEDEIGAMTLENVALLPDA